MLSPGLYQNLRGAIRPWGGSPGYGHLTLPNRRNVINNRKKNKFNKLLQIILKTYKPETDETTFHSLYIL